MVKSPKAVVTKTFASLGDFDKLAKVSNSMGQYAAEFGHEFHEVSAKS